MIVAVLASAALLTMKNQVDYLIEGEISQMALDPNFIEATKSCPTTNQGGEADFALLRMIKVVAPRLTATNLEARIKIKRNKPVTNFLDQKSPEEQAQILTGARKSAKRRGEQVKSIEATYLNGLKEKREKRILSKREREENQGKKNLELTMRWCASHGNIWLPSEVEEKLDKLPADKERLEAVNHLIEYLHNVCHAQSSVKEVFMKTKSKKPFSLNEKKEHLQLLFQQNPYLFSAPHNQSDNLSIPLDITTEAEAVIKKIRTKSDENDKKRLVLESRRLLPALKADPSKLLGCRFFSKRVQGSEVTWIEGIILELCTTVRKNLMFRVNMSGIDGEERIPVLSEIQKGHLCLSLTE